MTAIDEPLLEALRRPANLDSLTAPAWDDLLRRARRAGLLAKLAMLLEETGVEPDLPAKVRDHLVGARSIAEQHARVVRWEVNRLQRALRDVDVDIVLLKGAAYELAGLPPARGRLVGDVDFLVPKDRLGTVERSLLDHGWETVKLDPYDQQYYREWMHELPPLRHRERRTVVDVHHTILPETSRLHPDPAMLLAASRRLDSRQLRVLAPADMVLHSATHLFHDGDLGGGLRDLTDLDDLLRHFGTNEPGFWDRLVPRAEELDLLRPLYYVVRFCRALLGTEIPQEVVAAADAGRPSWPIPGVMDSLAVRALIPGNGRESTIAGDAARWLLFVRSHWLRMPAPLLIRHLSRKAWRRWADDRDAP